MSENRSTAVIIAKSDILLGANIVILGANPVPFKWFGASVFPQSPEIPRRDTRPTSKQKLSQKGVEVGQSVPQHAKQSGRTQCTRCAHQDRSKQPDEERCPVEKLKRWITFFQD